MDRYTERVPREVADAAGVILRYVVGERVEPSRFDYARGVLSGFHSILPQSPDPNLIRGHRRGVVLRVGNARAFQY